MLCIVFLQAWDESEEGEGGKSKSKKRRKSILAGLTSKSPSSSSGGGGGGKKKRARKFGRRENFGPDGESYFFDWVNCLRKGTTNVEEVGREGLIRVLQ